MRELYIDYGKAILTIMVITVHAGMSELNPWNYVRMIFFFFVTGYTYTVHKRSLSDGIKRRFTGIQIPFWRILLITVFLDMIRATYLGYGDYNIAKADIMFAAYCSGLVPLSFPFTDFFMYEGIPNNNGSMPMAYAVITPLNCHLWFLVSMFSGCVLFFTYMEKLRYRKWLDLLVITILLLIASFENINTFQLPFSLGRGCLACACMIAAVNAKEMRIFSVASIEHRFIYACIALCVFIFTSWHGASNCSFIISMYGDGSFLSVLITYLGGISGAIFILYLMQILERYCVSSTLAFIGRNTMTLYLWNLILLTFFSLLLLKLTGGEVELDLFNMALLPANSYILIILAATLTVASGTLMASYKKSHTESILSKLI